MTFLKQYEPYAYAAFRIMTGLLFLWHGMQKLFGFPLPSSPDLPFHVHFIAGPIELIGGTLVAVGLLTRPAAFLCSGLMAAAYFTAHASNGFFPLVNHGEPAVLYCFAYLFIATHGAGILSADAAIGQS